MATNKIGDISGMVKVRALDAPDFIDDVFVRLFLNELHETTNGNKLKLRIGSAGGFIFSSLAIYEAIKQHSDKVTTEIYGVTSGVAVQIAMAANEVTMRQDACLILLEPTIVAHSKEDMQKHALLLERIKETLLALFLKVTRLDEKELLRLISEGTPISAKEALERGFIDRIID